MFYTNVRTYPLPNTNIVGCSSLASSHNITGSDLFELSLQAPNTAHSCDEACYKMVIIIQRHLVSSND